MSGVVRLSNLVKKSEEKLKKNFCIERKAGNYRKAKLNRKIDYI